MTEEFVPLFATAEGKVSENPTIPCQVASVSSYIRAGAQHETGKIAVRRTMVLVEMANRILDSKSTRFKHPNGRVDLAAADCSPQETTLD